MATRLMFFAHGVGAHLIFLATFLYAVAFVGGFVVPMLLPGRRSLSKDDTHVITRKPGAATVGAFVIMSALAPAMLAADDQFHAQHGSGQRQAAASSRSYASPPSGSAT